MSERDAHAKGRGGGGCVCARRDVRGLVRAGRFPRIYPFAQKARRGVVIKVDSWPIGLYRHPPTKIGRSRSYLNRFSSGLEGR